jgi:hypothetical protein
MIANEATLSVRSPKGCKIIQVIVHSHSDAFHSFGKVLGVGNREQEDLLLEIKLSVHAQQTGYSRKGGDEPVKRRFTPALASSIPDLL